MSSQMMTGTSYFYVQAEDGIRDYMVTGVQTCALPILMGLWHGIEPHYIIYGLYQATLLSGFHIFSDWNKTRHYWHDGFLSNALAVFITFHFVCFGDRKSVV